VLVADLVGDEAVKEVFVAPISDLIVMKVDEALSPLPISELWLSPRVLLLKSKTGGFFDASTTVAVGLRMKWVGEAAPTTAVVEKPALIVNELFHPWYDWAAFEDKSCSARTDVVMFETTTDGVGSSVTLACCCEMEAEARTDPIAEVALLWVDGVGTPSSVALECCCELMVENSGTVAVALPGTDSVDIASGVTLKICCDKVPDGILDPIGEVALVATDSVGTASSVDLDCCCEIVARVCGDAAGTVVLLETDSVGTVSSVPLRSCCELGVEDSRGDPDELANVIALVLVDSPETETMGDMPPALGVAVVALAMEVVDRLEPARFEDTVDEAHVWTPVSVELEDPIVLGPCGTVVAEIPDETTSITVLLRDGEANDVGEADDWMLVVAEAKTPEVLELPTGAADVVTKGTRVDTPFDAGGDKVKVPEIVEKADGVNVAVALTEAGLSNPPEKVDGDTPSRVLLTEEGEPDVSGSATTKLLVSTLGEAVLSLDDESAAEFSPMVLGIVVEGNRGVCSFNVALNVDKLVPGLLVTDCGAGVAESTFEPDSDAKIGPPDPDDTRLGLLIEPEDTVEETKVDWGGAGIWADVALGGMLDDGSPERTEDDITEDNPDDGEVLGWSIGVWVSVGFGTMLDNDDCWEIEGDKTAEGMVADVMLGWGIGSWVNVGLGRLPEDDSSWLAEDSTTEENPGVDEMLVGSIGVWTDVGLGALLANDTCGATEDDTTGERAITDNVLDWGNGARVDVRTDRMLGDGSSRTVEDSTTERDMLADAVLDWVVGSWVDNELGTVLNDGTCWTLEDSKMEADTAKELPDAVDALDWDIGTCWTTEDDLTEEDTAKELPDVVDALGWDSGICWATEDDPVEADPAEEMLDEADAPDWVNGSCWVVDDTMEEAIAKELPDVVDTIDWGTGAGTVAELGPLLEDDTCWAIEDGPTDEDPMIEDDALRDNALDGGVGICIDVGPGSTLEDGTCWAIEDEPTEEDPTVGDEAVHDNALDRVVGICMDVGPGSTLEVGSCWAAELEATENEAIGDGVFEADALNWAINVCADADLDTALEDTVGDAIVPDDAPGWAIDVSLCTTLEGTAEDGLVPKDALGWAINVWVEVGLCPTLEDTAGDGTSLDDALDSDIDNWRDVGLGTTLENTIEDGALLDNALDRGIVAWKDVGFGTPLDGSCWATDVDAMDAEICEDSPSELEPDDTMIGLAWGGGSFCASDDNGVGGSVRWDEAGASCVTDAFCAELATAEVAGICELDAASCCELFELDCCCVNDGTCVDCELIVSTKLEDGSMRFDVIGSMVTDGDPSGLGNKLRVDVTTTTTEELLSLSEAEIDWRCSVVELELRTIGEGSRGVVDGVEVLVSFRHGWFCRLKMGDSTLFLGARSLPSAKKCQYYFEQV
jgi:hypothetical protein